jgi:co-chaperonin GroES (HSP10)
MSPIHHVTGNHVLIAREPEATKTPAGIILKEKPYWQDAGRVWIVVATGWGRFRTNKKTKRTRFVPIEVQPGQRVLVNFDKGNQFDFPTGERMIDADQIIARIDAGETVG